MNMSRGTIHSQVSSTEGVVIYIGSKGLSITVLILPQPMVVGSNTLDAMLLLLFRDCNNGNVIWMRTFPSNIPFCCVCVDAIMAGKAFWTEMGVGKK